MATATHTVAGAEDISAAELDYLDGVTPGTVVNDKALIAADNSDTTALLDFSSVTLGSGARVFRGSGLDFEAVTGWMAFSGNTATGFRYATYFQPSTDGDAKILGHGMFPDIAVGGSSDRIQALSTVMSVYGTLESRSGDATAGAHNVWAKFGADLSSATIDSGARICPLWSDIQVNNGDVSAEEVFGLMITNGGSKIRSFFRFETTGATYFLECDTAIGSSGFATSGTSGYNTTDGASQAGNLIVEFNGTKYGIPLMAAT